MNRNAGFLVLLEKYLNDRLDIEERESFFQLVASGNYDHLLEEKIGEDLKRDYADAYPDMPPHVAGDIIRHIYSSEK